MPAGVWLFASDAFISLDMVRPLFAVCVSMLMCMCCIHACNDSAFDLQIFFIAIANCSFFAWYTSFLFVRCILFLLTLSFKIILKVCYCCFLDSYRSYTSIIFDRFLYHLLSCLWNLHEKTDSPLIPNRSPMSRHWVVTMVRGSRGETQGLSCWNDEPNQVRYQFGCIDQFGSAIRSNAPPPPAQPPKPKWSEHVQVVSSWFLNGW